MAENESAAELERLATDLMGDGQRTFGLSAASVEKAMPNLIDLQAGDFLFQRVIEITGQTEYFETPRRILEIGCGTAPFVYSARLRGHEAFGIDNDAKRLAVARQKPIAYGLPPEWKDVARHGDAAQLDFQTNSFDLVLGWQVIEHIPNLTAALFEAVRVTRRGGLLAFWAPDYRAPYEPHYELPWPPFAPEYIAKEWTRAMGRPDSGIGTFFYISLYQVYAQLEALGCKIIMAQIDRPIDVGLNRAFDVSTPAALSATAERMLAGIANGALPPALRSPTSLMISAQKV